MKLWKKILLFLLLIIILFGGYHFGKIQRLIKVVNLFKPENITENFLTMEDIFPTNTINPASKPSSFVLGDMTFPERFSLNDSTLNTQGFIERSQTTGLIVLYGDTILHEEYYKGYSADEDHISWSVSKSLVSGLLGIAVQRGEISSIEDPVEKYAPILKGSGYEGVSIKDVLQMSSGIVFDEDYHAFFSDINKLGRVFALGKSFDNYVANMKSGGEAGKFHKYVSMDTQVLGMVIVGATKVTLSQYMEEHLWEKIGASDPAYWMIDDDGMEGAFAGLNCSLRDYARVGKLYADMGYAEGQQVIDTSWIISSTTATEPHLVPGMNNPNSNHPFGYGYQWWIPYGGQGDYMAMGVYSQFIYVDPIHKIVIMKNSANYHYKQEQRMTTWRHLNFFRSIRDKIIEEKGL